MQDLLVWKHTIQRCGMVWVVGRGYRGFLAWVATKQLPLWSSVPKYQYLQHLEWSPELDSKSETISIRQPVKMSNFKAEINTFTARYKKQFCSVYSECSEVLKPVNQLAFSHFKLPCFKVCRVFFFSFSFFFGWMPEIRFAAKMCYDIKSIITSAAVEKAYMYSKQRHSSTVFFFNFILILVNILNWTLEGPIVKSNANQTWLIWCSWSWAGASMIPVMVPTLVTGRLYLQIIPELQLNSSRLISLFIFFKCFLIM